MKSWSWSLTELEKSYTLYSGIALLGQPGSGKSSVGAELVKLVGGERLSFAGALKDELAKMLGWTSGAFTAAGVQGMVRYHRVAQDAVTSKDDYRPMLQALGSFRRAEDEDYWVKQALAGIKPDQFYVVDDCRYWNEYHALKNRNFAFLLLKPGPTTRPLTGEQAEHASERDWPRFPVDGRFEYVEGPAEMARIIAMALRMVE